MRRWVKSIIAGLITGLVGVVLGLTPLGVDFETGVGLNWLFNVRGAVEQPPDVVVVNIDARTGGYLDLAERPRDWSRVIHAKLIENLVQRGADAIAFDMDFRIPKLPEDDSLFADAIIAAQRVVLFTRLDGKRLPISELRGQSGGVVIESNNGDATNGSEKLSGSIWVERLIPPTPVIADAANGLAPFPLPKLQEDVFQYWAFKSSADDAATLPAVTLQIQGLTVHSEWMRLLRRVGAVGIESIPVDRNALTRASSVGELMRTLRRAFQKDPTLPDKLLSNLSSDESLSASPNKVRLIQAMIRLYQGEDNRLLNFYGPPGSIKTIPYHVFILGEDSVIDQEPIDLTGKVVFVGYSDLYDSSQPDVFYTVFSTDEGVDLSGVEIAATAFANLTSGRVLEPTSVGLTILTLLLFGGLLGAGVYLMPALISVPLAVIITVSYIVGAQYFFNNANIWLPLATPVLVQFPMAIFIGLLAQYLFGRKQEQQLTKAISYYLPEDVIGSLTEDGLDPEALNKTVYATCFATDMKGFTSISETMPPKQLATFMNDYFEVLSQPLKRHKVDVTEFRADAIMCAWITPEGEGQIRREAILAALETVEAVGEFNSVVPTHQLKARIGLDAGTVYIGHAGGGGHFVYSIVGDSANTASRIESLNDHLGTQMLASQSVVDGVDGFLFRTLGDFQFVGKTGAIAVVEVVTLLERANPSQIQLCERFSNAITAFKRQNWDHALIEFESILDDYPHDGAALFYKAHCQRYLDEPLPSQPEIIHMGSK